MHIKKVRIKETTNTFSITKVIYFRKKFENEIEIKIWLYYKKLNLIDFFKFIFSLDQYYLIEATILQKESFSKI